jgi:hypothetical protein
MGHGQPTSGPLRGHEVAAALDTHVARYLRRGYRVVARTPGTARLAAPKRRLFWHLARLVGRARVVTLTVDAQGVVEHGKGEPLRSGLR